MSYTLRPRNKALASLQAGGFSWPWMLDNGVGLPVGHSKGIEPASFIYRPRDDGKCIMYNDGAKVTAKEAKQMAQIARWLAESEDRRAEMFDKEPPDRQEVIRKNDHRIYSPPVRKDFIQRARDFADFAEKSGGFRVY